MLAMMWGNTAFPPRALAKRSSEVSPAIALLQERTCRTYSTTCSIANRALELKCQSWNDSGIWHLEE